MTDRNSTSSITEKVTGCMSCAKPVTYRTNSRVYCQSCRLAAKRERARVTSERKRRESGVEQVKGTIINCKECGTEFERASLKSIRCKPCQHAFNLRGARAASRRKARAGGLRVVGNSYPCRHCSATFTMTAPRLLYCEKCRELQRLNKLPHLKKWREVYVKEWMEKNYKGARRSEYQAMMRKARQRAKEKHGHAFTINERMSAGIRQSLKLGKGGWRWEKIVGYTLDELAVHLDRQFTKGMTWDEFMSGNIHIDHIVPKTAFQFEGYEDPEFKQCWALSNLRPMWAKENIQKNARRMYLL